MPKLLTRKRIRIKHYNYSESGYYFVTVCSNNRENIFGEYNKYVGAGLVSARNNIKLSEIGRIIDNQWNNIPNQFDNIKLDKYIIMPNHIHGIIIINDMNRAETSPAPTLSDIICSFKSKSTLEYLNYLKQNNIQMPMHIWQRSFYDHVIRNERSLNAIRNYIANNPENWENDIDNLLNL